MDESRSKAQQFVDEEMVFNDVPATLPQHIVSGYIAFADGSFLVCENWQVLHVAPANAIPVHVKA